MTSTGNFLGEGSSPLMLVFVPILADGGVVVCAALPNGSPWFDFSFGEGEHALA